LSFQWATSLPTYGTCGRTGVTSEATIMNYVIEERVMEELERAVCRLESMGTILASLCEADRNTPDVSALADLGALISKQAMDTLNLLAEKEQLKVSIKLANLTKAPEKEANMPRIWFIPEIPSD